MSQNLNTWDESGTYEAECSRKVTSGRRVAGAIRSLVNARSLQLECARILHESLLMFVLTYDIERMIWRKKEKYRIWVVQIDSLRVLLGIGLMDKVPNARIMQLCGVRNDVNEKIDGSAMWREWRMRGLLRGSI